MRSSTHRACSVGKKKKKQIDKNKLSILVKQEKNWINSKSGFKFELL